MAGEEESNGPLDDPIVCKARQWFIDHGDHYSLEDCIACAMVYHLHRETGLALPSIFNAVYCFYINQRIVEGKIENHHLHFVAERIAEEAVYELRN